MALTFFGLFLLLTLSAPVAAQPVITSLSDDKGSANSSEFLDIFGTGFVNGQTQVTFGGTPATVLFAGPTQIQLLTPLLPQGIVDLVVTTPAGSVTLSNGYKYADSPSLVSFTPNRVPSPGGSAITISGSGFTFAEDVEIDGTGVPFTIVNDTTISLISPPHVAGPVAVIVQNFAGSSSMGPAITFVDAPLVSAAAPNTGTAAGGTVVTITGTRFTGVHSVEIGGQPASFTFDNDGQITATTPAHMAGPADIVVQADGGSGTLASGFTYVAVGTTTTLGTSANPAMRGTLITLTATVTPAAGATPTGSVAFEAGGTVLGTVALAGGTATFATDALPTGTTGIIARYLGDASHVATTSTQLDQVITERPGTLTLIVVSGVDGQAFDFISATPALNLTTVTAAGRAQSGPISLAAGSYAVTLAGAADYGLNLASIDCGSGASINLDARAATITIDPDSAISCIFRLADIKALTSDLIGEFLQLRGSLLLVSQPDIQRRIDRAAGRTSVFSSPLPMLMQYLAGPASRGQIDVSAALSSFDALAGTQKPSLFDAWIEGTFAQLERSEASANFQSVAMGADYILTPGTLLGGYLQVDHTSLTRGEGNASGRGWLIGPYFTARLAEGLYFDTIAGVGHSTNSADPLDIGGSAFATNRWMLGASLQGQWQDGHWTHSPRLQVSYIEETSLAYVDRLGVAIPSIAAGTGQISAGHGISYGHPLESGVLETGLRLDGVAEFSGPQGYAFHNVHARMEARMSLAGDGGGRFGVSLTHAGLGQTSQTTGLRLQLGAALK